MNTPIESSWITVCGEQDFALQQKMESQVQAKIDAKLFPQKEIEYLQILNRKLVHGEFAIEEKRLEILRRLCQLWEIEIVPPRITSHRKYIGRFIVAGKKFLFPILRMLLKDTIKKQREFNATAITLLTELARK